MYWVMNPVVYGRSVNSPISITDPTVSSEHALLELVDGSWIIEDLNSSNGTFVNGKRITRSQVFDDDLVHLGKCELIFHSGRLLGSEDASSPAIDSGSNSPKKDFRRKSSLIYSRRVIHGVLASFVTLAVIFLISLFVNQNQAQEFANSTVFITARTSGEDLCWTGSGFVIGDGSLVATNAHVAAPATDASYSESQCTQIEIGYTTDERAAPEIFRRAKILELSEVEDLALLQIDSPLSEVKPMKLSTARPTIGEALSVYGYPGLGGETITVSTGVVSGFNQIEGIEYIKISAVINSGNSGGPVVGKDKSVIGVATAANRAGIECVSDGECFIDGQNVGLARPVGLLLKWLAQHN